MPAPTQQALALATDLGRIALGIIKRRATEREAAEKAEKEQPQCSN